MKTLKSTRKNSIARRALALAAMFVLLAGMLPLSLVSAQTKTAARRLSEEQQIAHVLNRFAFGARPGDIERVHQIGLDHWFEQQLHPDKIDDAAAGAKLAPLTTLTMRNDELFAKFPQPGQLVRQLQRQGKLPADLQALAQERKQGNAQNNTTDAS